ncbi:hypothetical protein O181_023932 [Austropuccinia psidii MF-1]|uniref:Uncharacterized protein n=1 Tax=Austropuccinia psidii MF-1 TaxID=1389203 RepID=A0A9Q3CKH3_9BASI|nr:hypothetical protein [Austropuccinia psidii MF-1]
MSFNRFTAFDYVNPDDPLAELDTDHIINQKNQQISFLQQQLQQSQNAYWAVLEKGNHLQIDKSLNEKKDNNNQQAKKQSPTPHNRSKLCDIHYKFGVANNFPKRYLKILSNPDAHSDDEYISKNTYKINKLEFRSENANKFMQRVDEEIEKVERMEKKQSKRRNQIKVDSPSTSRYSQPPKGLPIDFYDPAWFNTRPYGKKTVLAHEFNVAFLPDASQCIHGIQHQEERLSNRSFTEKYLEQCTFSYSLSHEIAKHNEDSDSNNNEAQISNEISESNDNNMEEILEIQNFEEQEFDPPLDGDTEMAHEHDLTQFVVGGSGLSSTNEWEGNW